MLRSLQRLDPATPSREVIVVDNDGQRSAEPIVRQAIADGIEILYEVEPVQSIALARTRSVRCAQGTWVAFVDDDEEADPRWLLELWTLAQDRDVDGAFGVVRRRFEPATPDWIRTVYPNHERTSGALLRWWEAATNNALVRRSAMLALGELFNPTYALTGGEDSDLFQRMAQRGSALVGVSSAVVYETVPAGRATVAYLLRWWLGAGALFARMNIATVPIWRLKLWLLGRVLLLAGYGLAGAVCFLFSRARGLRYFLRAAYEAGILFGKLTGSLVQRYPIRDQLPL